MVAASAPVDALPRCCRGWLAEQAHRRAFAGRLPSPAVEAWSTESERAPYRVLGVHVRTPAVAELALAPVAERLAYRAGQYVLLEDREGALAPRAYSIANALRPDGRLSLLVKREPGGRVGGWVHERLAPDDRVRISGPYGTFVDEATGPTLFLAAGSGVAPIRAMLEAALSTPRRRALTLVVSAQTEADVVDGAGFAAWQRRDPRFRFLRTLTTADGPPPHGRIPDVLEQLAGRLDGHDVFIAGPPGFVHGCARAAAALGAGYGAIHTEVSFADPPSSWGETGPRTRG